MSDTEIPKGDGSYEIRPVRLMIAPKGQAIFDTGVIFVEIQDEAAGEFVEVFQNAEVSNEPVDKVKIDAVEWPTLRSAIDYMVKQCRE